MANFNVKKLQFSSEGNVYDIKTNPEISAEENNSIEVKTDGLFVPAAAEIDDLTTSTTKVWSSDKINTELEKKAEIDDTQELTDKVWSSDKVSTELEAKAEIDDTQELTDKTWSSDKISEEISGAITFTYESGTQTLTIAKN